MEMKRNDPYSYLSKTGLMGNKSPTKLKVCEVTVGVSGSSHGKGALGSASNESAKASKAKIDFESARYNKLEKRTTKSMRHGGSEKELRDGHNFSLQNAFGIPGGDSSSSKPKKTGPSKKQLARPEWREKHSVASAKADLKTAKKAGGDTSAAKQAFQAAKGERKTVFNTLKAARKDVKNAGDKTARTAAKGVLGAAKTEAKTRFAGQYAKKQAERKARKSKSGGGVGIGDILGGGLF